MRLSKQGWGFICASAVLASFGAAFAQPAPAGELPPAVGVTTSRDVAMEPLAMARAARQYVPVMVAGKRSVDQMVKDAKHAKDVVKALCLSDKQQQIDVAIRSAKDRIASLADAAMRNDRDRAGLEFKVATALKERVTQLVAEANQCIGEETGFIGDSKVKMDVDHTVPDVDPSEFPEEPVDEFIFPPIPVSPTI